MTIHMFNGTEFRPIGSGSGAVNVREHGARGNGLTDDTVAFSAAIEAAALGGIRTVTVPDGVYMIRAHDPVLIDPRATPWAFTGGIRMLSGVHLQLSGGATLKAINAGDIGHYKIIYAYQVNNIEISGGTIEGDRATHSGSTGQWGHGISLMGCTDVYIHDILLKDCWGDGINVLPGGAHHVSPVCERVWVNRVVCDNNRRQGISISGVTNMTVENSVFSNTNGTAPEDGIDIEPNYKNSPGSDITIRKCLIQGNNGNGIQSYNGTIERLTITDCRIVGNKGAAGQISLVGAVSYQITDNWFDAGSGSARHINLSEGTCTIARNRMTGGLGIKGAGLTSSRIADNIIDGSGVNVDSSAKVAVEGNLINGGNILASGGNGNTRLAITGNRVTGATGAAISVTSPTTDILIHANEAWACGSGVEFDIGQTHTGHRVDTAWMDGTDTLPS